MISDPSKYHLAKITCSINEYIIDDGMIYVENKDNIYIFQNKYKGFSPDNKEIVSLYNYTYSWRIDNLVKNIQLVNQLTWWW